MIVVPDRQDIEALALTDSTVYKVWVTQQRGLISYEDMLISLVIILAKQKTTLIDTYTKHFEVCPGSLSVIKYD